MSLYLPLFKALNDAGVKYVVVGGVATVLHGYARLTMDVDLMVDLAPEEATRTVQALESLGFKPRVPVPAMQFADAAKRKEWIEQKGMTVFSFHNPSNPMLTVDVFVDHPIPFIALRSRAEKVMIDAVPVYICSIDDLIALKQLAGRPQDLIGIENSVVSRRSANMANTESTPEHGHLYPVTWDEVKEAELDDALRATPAQRLAWLEEALRLAWKAGANNRE